MRAVETPNLSRLGGNLPLLTPRRIMWCKSFGAHLSPPDTLRADSTQHGSSRVLWGERWVRTEFAHWHLPGAHKLASQPQTHPSLPPVEMPAARRPAGAFHGADFASAQIQLGLLPIRTQATAGPAAFVRDPLVSTRTRPRRQQSRPGWRPPHQRSAWAPRLRLRPLHGTASAVP